MKRRRVRRWMVSLIGGSLLILLSMHFLLFFFGDEILKKSILVAFSQYVTHQYPEAETQPSLDFDNLRINLFSGKLVITEIEFEDSQPIPHDTSGATSKIVIPELEVDGINLWEIYRGKFHLRSVHLLQPSLQLVSKSEIASKKPDIGEQLKIISHNFYESVQGSFHSFSISTFYVEDAQVRVYLRDSLKQPEFSSAASHFYANHLHATFTDFKLDSATQYDENRFFFTKNIEVRLSDHKIMLPDSSYFFRADTLSFSTIDQKLALRQAEIVPEKAAQLNEDQYLYVKIPALEFTHLNLHELYFDSLLKVQELNMHEPHIQLYGNFDRNNSVQISSLGLRKLHPDSLYALISHRFAQLSVDHFKLRGGELNIYDIHHDSVTLLDIKQFSLAFNDFLLTKPLPRLQVDSLNYVLPMDSITLELTDIKINMPDRIHSLTSEFVSLKTDRQRRYQCDLLVDSVHIKPEIGSLTDLFDLSPSSVRLGYDIAIEKVLLYDLDLEDLSRRKLIYMDSLAFVKPRVNITNFSGVPFGGLADESNISSVQNTSVKEMLYDWSQARLDLHPIIAPGRNTALFSGIYVDHINIDSGTVDLKEANYSVHSFDPIASLENVSAFISQARIDNIGNSIQGMRRGYNDYRVAVHANDFDIVLENGVFRLPNDGGPTSEGTLQFASASISTARSAGFIKGLYIWPNRLVTASSRNQIRQIFFPYIELSGFDFDKFYNQQQANISHLFINSPQIRLAIDDNQISRKVRHSDITMQNLFHWIDPYVNAVTLHQLDVINAKLLVERRYADQKDFHNFITAETLNLKLQGFFLDSVTQMTRKKPLYATHVWLEAKDYTMNFLADHLPEVVSVRGEKLAFSTQDNQLKIHQLDISPMMGSISQQYNFQIDEVKLDYVDIYDLLKYDQLLLNQLSIRSPRGKITIKYTEEKNHVKFEKAASLQPDLYVYIQDFFTKVKVGHLSLQQGTVEYTALNQDTTCYMRADTINISATNVLIDPQIRKQNKLLYADQADFRMYVSRYFLKMQESQQQLNISNMLLSHADAQIKAEQVSLQPLHYHANPGKQTGKNANKLYRITIPSLVMQGVAFEKAFLQGDWVIEQINFTKPEIYVSHTPSYHLKKPKTYREIVGNLVNSIRVDQISVKEGKFKLDHFSNEKSNDISVERIDAYLDNFYLDQQVYEKVAEESSVNSDITRRLLFADELVIKVKDYQHKLRDSLHIMRAEEINLSTKKSSLAITSFTLEPRLEQYEIKDHFPHQKIWADCRIPIINLQNVDLEGIISKGAYKADLINIVSPHLVLFQDKRLPRDFSSVRPMPQEMLMKLNFPVTIDSVKVFNGFISYEERMPGADRNGKITFDRLNAKLSQVTNDQKVAGANVLMSVEANTYLLGKGYLEVALNFHLGSSDRMFSVIGSLGPMDLTQFNTILEPVAFLHIREGFSNGINFQFVGNKERSSGAMRFNYHDLHVLLVDRQTGALGLDEKVGSFLANTFVLKADNPAGTSLRIGKIAHQRDETHSIFNFLWQSLLSGIKSSVGVDKRADKIKDFTLLQE